MHTKFCLAVLKPFLALLLLVWLSGCKSYPVEDGKITVINDSKDSEYNTLQISGSGFSHELDPGEFAILPKGTKSIYFSRIYKDYTRSYEVRCPEVEGSGLRMKLIDVHVNRIAGGCETVASSKG
jgi:hypothetical protein